MPATLREAFQPPASLTNDFGTFRSPLNFYDGRLVTSHGQWPGRRREIISRWTELMGPWPPLVENPRWRILEETNRQQIVQRRVEVELAQGSMQKGILLIPAGRGPFPAVVVPFYEPETSAGFGKPLIDFGWQLTQRGFVTLSIGSPGGDARKPDKSGARCQPLSFLAYVAANAHTALTQVKEVDPKRIGIVGHSYGSKWAMLASCLWEQYAAAVWCDGGIVFDESRSNVNYWEPWYLGEDPHMKRTPGIPKAENPRTGAYKILWENGYDLHELHALMAPRPFLVSGGSEEPVERWRALNHTRAVNHLLGFSDRVGFTTRPTHAPTPESNEVIYQFFEHFLK